MLDFLLSNPVVLDILFGTISLVSCIFIAYLNVKRAKKECTNAVDTIFEIMNAVQNAEASLTPLKEILGKGVGAMKKADVLTKIQNYCFANNIQYDEAYVSDILDKLIKFSKKVNVKINLPITEEKENG